VGSPSGSKADGVTSGEAGPLNYAPEAAERVRQVLSSRDGVVEQRGLDFVAGLPARPVGQDR
jgi:hypothetical protein